jgi:hypothetical protein
MRRLRPCFAVFCELLALGACGGDPTEDLPAARPPADGGADATRSRKTRPRRDLDAGPPADAAEPDTQPGAACEHEGQTINNEAGGCELIAWGCSARGEQIEAHCRCPEAQCVCYSHASESRYQTSARFCEPPAQATVTTTNGCNARELPKVLCGMKVWE